MSKQLGLLPNTTPIAELARVLIDLIKTGDIPEEVVIARLKSIREEFHGKAKAVNRNKELAVSDRKRELNPIQKEQLLSTLKARFENHMERHKDLQWEKVEARLNEASPEKLWSLNEMEKTGGEPDVVGFDETTGEYEFFDCSKESPIGRRNICYDRDGQADRYGSPFPAGNAIDMASNMCLGGILDENQTVNILQTIGEFDMNSWNWIYTPVEKRKENLALDASRDIDGPYVTEYNPRDHNLTRGFRGWLKI